MDAQTSNEISSPLDVANTSSLPPVARLPDAQVFSRDPENYTAESTADTIERLKRIVARQRKARDDDAAVKAAAVKFKKANAAARKKKGSTAVLNPDDIMESTL